MQRAFCEEGAAVVGCDVIDGGAEQQAAELTEQGYRAYGRTVDLSDDQAARRWVEWGVETLGGLDVVYNNAAATNFAPFKDMTKALWKHVIHNELDSTFYVTLAAWPHLIDRGGSIINVSSVSALVADAALGQSAHTVAKAGVIALARQLAAEGGPHNIRVNCISPGVIVTPATAADPPPMLSYLVGHTFLGRVGTPADIVPTAIYLASNESAYVTGANLVVGGGWSVGAPQAASESILT